MNLPIETTILTGTASVHASAGSGKTYLLVSRIVRLLLLGNAPANILAITFTRKAASEMQMRLMERLYQLSSLPDEELSKTLHDLELPESEILKQNTKQLYEKLLHDTQRVKVTTFHAFCQDLLRRFPLEADVPPGFDLEDKTAILRKTAWHALMSEASKQPKGPVAQNLNQLLTSVSPTQMKTLLERFLMYRSDWWAYTQNSANPIDYAQGQLTSQIGYQDTVGLVETFLQQHLDSLQRYAELLAKHPTATNLKTLDKLSINQDSQSKNSEQRLWKITSAFFTAKNEPRKQKTSKTLITKLGDAGAEEFITLHYQLTEHIEAVHKELAAKQLIDVNRAWLTAGQAYLHHYQQIKLEQRVLDFTDLEWKTYQLLNHGNNTLWIQYKLDERINHLLIDEFQDTNPTQWHLILPLLTELAAGKSERNRSVFLVGDAKQSIYRFRRANAKLFNQASQWLEGNLHAQRFPLNKSWRSSPAIMTFVNSLFSELNNTDFEFETHDTHRAELYGKVTLLPLIKEQETEASLPNELRNPLLSPRPEKENKRFLEEGRQIANTIKNLLQQPLPIQDGQSVRPMRYKDILILFKTRTHINYYEQAFREAGIPYLGADRGTLLDSLEVNDMLNLLQWLITPYDNLALAGILKSPLFSTSDDDLLQLAHSGETDWFHALANRVEDTDPATPATSLTRAYTLLQGWQSLTGYLPVHDLLDKIYSQANVIERYKAAFPKHLSSRVQANLTRFIELALEMDSGRYPSLTRFTSWINELKQQTDDAPDAPSETGSDDRISLMTIHGAKGLESPVVFIADSGNENKEKNSNSVIIEWPTTEAQPSHFMLAHKTDFTPDFIQRCFDKENQQAQLEDTNLLYVAITRAKQYLYISASQPRRTSTLGWYGTIARHHQLDTDELAQPLLLAESGTSPELNYSVKEVPELTVNSKGLTGPFNIKPRYREIAPSRTLPHQNESNEYVGTDEDAKIRGIIIHLMLEKLSLTPSLSLPQLKKDLHLSYEQEELENYWQEALDIINHSVLATLFEPQQYEKAYSELPVMYKKEKITVYGIIDRLIVRQDVIQIIDYKTHQHADEKTIPALIKQYQPQMSLYAEAIQHLWPKHNIEAYLLFTHSAVLKAVPLSK